MTTLLFCISSLLALWAVAVSKPPASSYTIDTFLSDMYAFNSFEQGYIVVRRRFAGLWEFEHRPDYLEALSQYCEQNASLPEEEKTFEHYIAEHLYYIYTGIPYSMAS